VGPETAKVCEKYVTVLVRGKSRSPWVVARNDDELRQLTVVHTVTTDMMGPARVDIYHMSGCSMSTIHQRIFFHVHRPMLCYMQSQSF